MWHVPYIAGVIKKNKWVKLMVSGKPLKCTWRGSYIRTRQCPFLPLCVLISIKTSNYTSYKARGHPFAEGSGWEIHDTRRGSVTPLSLSCPALINTM